MTPVTDAPFPLIRTVTVGAGIPPGSADPAGWRALAGCDRRWGISPRPENVLRVVPRRGVRGKGFQPTWYLASSASIARTLSADVPSGSNRAPRNASAMSLASSAPTTRAPIVITCALFDVAALPAE